jgi:hypothetical protein
MAKTSRTPTDVEARQILAAVARETRSYTDPRADYPIARQARDAQTAGAMQRRAA